MFNMTAIDTPSHSVNVKDDIGKVKATVAAHDGRQLRRTPARSTCVTVSASRRASSCAIAATQIVPRSRYSGAERMQRSWRFRRGAKLLIARSACLSLVTIVGLSPLATTASALITPRNARGAPRAGGPPRQWDRRILPLVRFVEHTRGLTFKHPVAVQFLSGEAFNKESGSTPGSPGNADRARLDAAAGTLRSVGLAEIDSQTLFNEENTLNSAEIEAFYDSDKKEIFVRGTSLDLSTRVTVAHELTHALQDQYFDLNRLNDAAQRRGDDASDAMTSLIEGDAVHVEDSYVGSLAQSQQNRYYAAQNQLAAAAEGAVSGNVPAVLHALSEIPYDVGPSFVQALLDNGGNARLNGAFTRPPRSDADIINPARYLSGLVAPRLAAPRIDAGKRRVGSPSSLGAVALYFMLAGRLDPLTALKAADAWDADRYVRFEQNGVQCLRVTFVGRNKADTGVLAHVLAAWAPQGPSVAATTQANQTGVTMRACDPGGAAVPSDARIMNASMTLAERAALVGQAIVGGLSPSTAQCTADRLVADPAVATFLALDQPTQPQIDEFSRKAQNATRACHG